MSEDVLGKPFIGPAGKLLDKIIEQAIDGQWDYALTNLVACLPLESEDDKLQEPPKEAIITCSTRLKEFVALCQPSLVVSVGKLAAKHAALFLTPKTVQVTDILHPAAILRMDASQRGLAIRRNIITLEDALVTLGSEAC